jgi:hypothetical protein
MDALNNLAKAGSVDHRQRAQRNDNDHDYDCNGSLIHFLNS